MANASSGDREALSVPVGEIRIIEPIVRRQDPWNGLAYVFS